MNMGCEKKSSFDTTQVVKIDFDFKHDVEEYKATHFTFVPNAKTHARRLSKQEVPIKRKISTSIRPWQGPQTLTLKRDKDGYGFSLRYFVVYTPNTESPNPNPNNSSEKGFNRNSYWFEHGFDCSNEGGAALSVSHPQPLDTFFVKSVDLDSAAEKASLKSGDRIVSINGELIGGKSYKDVIEQIQFCTGELKLGVVPHDEDILQMVYEEYVHDNTLVTSSKRKSSTPSEKSTLLTPTERRLSSTSSGTSETQLSGTSAERSLPIALERRRSSSVLSATNMQQPSVNKWSVPILTRKSLTLDSNGNNVITSNLMNSEKYDPCVQFIAGKPATPIDGKGSRSGSVSSSGSATPLQITGKISPPSRNSGSIFDPCVSFIGGKPQVIAYGESSENRQSLSDVQNEDIENGFKPQTLENALSREAQKKTYSVGTRLAPKPIAGVSKPGAVSNIAGLFASGNLAELSSSSIRKKSATLCLRDDFQIRSCKNKVQGIDGSAIDNCKAARTNSSSRKSSTNEENDESIADRNNTPATRNRRGTNLSSTTSQATLVESEGSPCTVNHVVTINGTTDGQIHIKSPFLRKRTLLANGRQISVSSSVENSDDEDSHVESGDESALDNWNGRRTSYLNANAKLAEKKGKKNFDFNIEADDEDSDSNTSKNASAPKETEVKKVIKEGPLNRKLERSLDKKKPNQRQWKPVYAVLKGHRLFCYKDGSGDADDEIIQPIPVRGTIIEIANDYGKRKHVFRLVTSHGNEYLFQAEDASNMVSWVNTLRDANPDKESLMKSTAILKREEKQKQAEKAEKEKLAEEIEKNKEKNRLSIKRAPFSGLRGSKKFRSPSTPPRQPNEPAPGKTFGRQLKDCPPGLKTKNIPLIIEHCCNAIESRGKDTIGIYRIPGNAAAVQALQRELDEKNPSQVNWSEEKWFEVNNIGSLLKAFLRKLAEPVIPNDMYMKLIQSNRISDGHERLEAMKHLIKSLPAYHYETLEFLIRHLRALTDNCEKNKMDPKNIAIVFGPNIVRTNENASMVQNMPDQCRIVETLLKQCDWMFAANDDDFLQPLHFENDSEVISSGVTKGLMECYNNQQNTIVIEHDGEISNKKVGKLHSLKTNISMKLRNTSTKVVSPRSNKKTKNRTANEEETDDDTSGFHSQSPPIIIKNEKNFRVSEASIRSSSEGQVTQNTKIGLVIKNNELEIQIKPGFRSPEMSPELSRSKSYMHNEDGNDSGVTSPPRLDSDDNMSVYSDSGAQSSRKESFESLSGPSPRIERRLHKTQQSTGSSSNEEKSPPLQKSVFVNKYSVQEEATSQLRRENTRNKNRLANTNDKDSTPSHKRSPVIRRREANFSPRASKRELYSIMPGDGNNYEEKILALLDPEYAGELKQQAKTELQSLSRPISPVNTMELNSQSNSTVFTPTSPDALNSDWWLSGSQSVTKRMANSPKDKESALNIISSVIQSKTKIKSHDLYDEECLKRNPLLSPTIVRRTMPLYNTELSKLVNNHNQKVEEYHKKMFNILNDKETSSRVKKPTSLKIETSEKIKTISSLRSPTCSTMDESKTEKFDRYLRQVSELLSDEANSEEREKINNILHSFQTAHGVIDQQTPHRRINSERSRPIPTNTHDSLHRTRSGPSVARSRNVVLTHRQSPLLDETYSSLNYNKLYPR